MVAKVRCIALMLTNLNYSPIYNLLINFIFYEINQ